MKREKTLTVKPIPVPLGSHHPEAPNVVLPNHEFSMGLIAPKGAGKTTLLCNLLSYYRGYFHSIYVFSPTVNNDDKWDWVKTQPLLSENTKLDQWLKKLKKKQSGDNTVVQKPTNIPDDFIEGLKKEGMAENDKFTGKIPEDCFMAEYVEEDLTAILNQQQQMVDFLKLHGKGKHLANRILFLFDDLVGSSLFSSARRSTFKMLNTNHRHLSASLLMVSQAFKEIPKTVRTNFTCLILFEIYSDSEIEAIYNEYPMGLKRDQWIQLYQYCVKEDHSFLFYNIQKPKPVRIMKQLSEVVFFQ